MHFELPDTAHSIAIDYFGRTSIIGLASGIIVHQLVDGIGISNGRSEIYAHTSPVTCLEFAHPSFGCIFASAAKDGTVKTWEKVGNATVFECKTEFNVNYSANSLRFAPHEYGCTFAVSNQNGEVTVFNRDENKEFYKEQSFKAHGGSCTSLAWSPSTPPTALLQPGIPLLAQKRIVTCGADKNVYIWR
ncbi:MAG: putative Protein transport protein sec13, partial [Streblomastix strix]